MKLKLRRELSTIYTGGKRIVVYDNGDVEEENLGEEAPAEPLTKSEKQIIKEALMTFLGQEKLVGFDLREEVSRIINKPVIEDKE